VPNLKLSSGGRRVLAVSLAGLALIYLVYVVGVFAALRWGALAALTKDSRDAHVEAQGGHSFWPTRIVLKNARFRFKDYNIEVMIEVREATILWSPLALLSKRIQIDEFVAEGARYKMLHRVKHRYPNRERLAAFPDTGFSRSKIYDSPKPVYHPPPFRIQVLKIRASVEEAWILEYRALGHMEATGGFDLSADVVVFPGHVAFRGARILVGDKTLASRVDCDLYARIGPFPGREPLDAALAVTDGRAVDCRMALADLSALGVYFPDSPVILEGKAELVAKVELARGQARSSELQVDAHLERLGLEHAFVSGDARVLGRAADTGQLRLTASFSGNPAPRGPLELRLAEVEILAEQPKLTQSKLTAAQLKLGSLNVRDPTLLRQMSESKEAPLVKIGRGDLDLSYVARTPAKPGRFELQSQGALAWFPKPEVAISCEHRASVRCQLVENGASCPGSALACAPATVDFPEGRSASVRASLQTSTLRLAPETATSEWKVSLGNPKAMLQAALPDNAWTDLGLALAPLGDVEGRGRVNLRKRTIAGTIDDVRSGAFSAQAGFMLATSAVSRWRIVTPLGRFGVNQTSSGTNITPFVGHDWDVLAFED